MDICSYSTLTRGHAPKNDHVGGHCRVRSSWVSHAVNMTNFNMYLTVSITIRINHAASRECRDFTRRFFNTGTFGVVYPNKKQEKLKKVLRNECWWVQKGKTVGPNHISNDSPPIGTCFVLTHSLDFKFDSTLACKISEPNTSWFEVRLFT